MVLGISCTVFSVFFKLAQFAWAVGTWTLSICSPEIAIVSRPGERIPLHSPSWDDTVFSEEMLWGPSLDQVLTLPHVAQSSQIRVAGCQEPVPLSQGAWLEGCSALSKATKGTTHDVCRIQRNVCQTSLSGRLIVKNDGALSCRWSSSRVFPSSRKLPPAPTQLGLWAFCLYPCCAPCPTPITATLHGISLHTLPDIALDITFCCSVSGSACSGTPWMSHILHSFDFAISSPELPGSIQLRAFLLYTFNYLDKRIPQPDLSWTLEKSWDLNTIPLWNIRTSQNQFDWRHLGKKNAELKGVLIFSLLSGSWVLSHLLFILETVS